ncbi:hypothetical protein [Aurantimonas coralicida]|uniref:hypothetical protein n=1 Tax=Aurantimonas coralicida TaxID=182270 RepID=UPI001E5C4C88|nr:hypothetical protein [Aurantimonas coralicida]
MLLEHKRSPIRIDQGLALSAFDLLASMVTHNAARFDGFDAVNDYHRGLAARLVRSWSTIMGAWLIFLKMQLPRQAANHR